MIGSFKIIVDSLWDSYYPDIVSDFICVSGKLEHGVHGIVSADIEERFNLKIPEQRENLFVNLVIFLDFRQFVAAASQEGRRGPLQQINVEIGADVL